MKSNFRFYKHAQQILARLNQTKKAQMETTLIFSTTSTYFASPFLVFILILYI